MHDDVKSAALNPYHMAIQQFEAAADKINLSEDMREILRQPKRELTVNFPVRLDNGRVRTFTGYRVQHNVNRGPAKGGIRYGPDVTLDEVKAFGFKYAELAGTYNMAPEQFGQELRKRGIEPVSGHFAYEKFRDDVEGIAKEAKSPADGILSTTLPAASLGKVHRMG